MRKLLLSSAILLSLSACNKEPIDIGEMPSGYTSKSAINELPAESNATPRKEDEQKQIQEELYKAIVFNDMETVNRLISRADVNYNYEKQYMNGTHLEEGVEKFSADELLYSDAEGGDCSDITLLIDACDRGNPELVRTLLRAGANIEGRDNYGHTPLMHASRWGDTEIASLLLSEGANINAKDGAGRTPLMMATSYEDNKLIAKNRTKIVSLLLKAGADVNATDNHGSTALTDARLNNYEDIVPLLLEAGAKE